MQSITLQRMALLVLALLSSASVFAQKVAVKKVELAGEKIIVYYDLEDSNPNNDYQINLFASTNNFATALTKVSGDVGVDVRSGAGKKITWNAREELGPYRGKLSLEVRGKVYAPVARISNVSLGSRFKRGKTHSITWKAGNTNPIHIEFMKGGERISGELNQPNNGRFSLFIPKHVSLGNDYTIKITDSRNAEDVVVSQPFRVTAKVPFFMKVLPVAIAGVVLAILLPDKPVEDSKLPDPPQQN